MGEVVHLSIAPAKRPKDARKTLHWMAKEADSDHLRALRAEADDHYDDDDVMLPSISQIREHMNRLAKVIDVLEEQFCLQAAQLPRDVLMDPPEIDYLVNPNGELQIGYERFLVDSAALLRHSFTFDKTAPIDTQARFHSADTPLVEFTLALYDYACSRGYKAERVRTFVQEVVHQLDLEGLTPDGRVLSGADFADWLDREDLGFTRVFFALQAGLT